MKKLLLVGVALVAISSVPAIAADMGARPAPVYKAAPAVVAPNNWTGFYVGGQVGYQWSDSDLTSTLAVPFGGFPAGTLLSSNELDAHGVVGGGHVGFNWQSGQLVFGIEGDFEWSGVDGSDIVLPTATAFGLGAVPGPFAFSQNWQASLRGRLGWVWDRFMVYATGGVAWMDYDLAITGGGPPVTVSASHTATGWTIGGGLEWGMYANWTARLEYRFTQFKSESFTGPAGGPFAAVSSFGDDVDFHTVRVGLSYKFGDWGKGPVVGRY